ncbi:MAG: hypothetical protein M3Y54_11995 [Bacteroidota bacterium]|nr:hypothetical protein [Bacteroidota bacterium]
MAKKMTAKTTRKPAPQKAAAAATQLVHIKSAGPGKSLLSKEQRAFNRYTKQITKLEKDLHDYREAATALRQRVQSEYRPLQARHNDARAALMRLLDKAYETQKLTKGEKKKVEDLITSNCYDLIERGYDDLKPLFARYEKQDFDTASEEADKEVSEMMKQLFSAQFGIEFDPDVDVSTQEKFQAYVAGKMAEQDAEYEAEEQQAARRASRKKSPKQQAAAEQQAAEEKNITKAVRSLYMDLVKALHPDREPDPIEAARKTELLKRVTSAYRANELLTLLRLQLELQRIDQTHLENLADNQLSYYNKLLKEQVKELEQSLFEEQMDWSDFTGKPYFYTSTPTAMQFDYDMQQAALNQKIRQLEAEVLAFGHDPAALKAFLKDYKIPKPDSGPVFMQF